MLSNKFYSKQGLWTLFLMGALPLHIWTIFLALRDFDWIATRTNSWDAVGVISYGLVFAFIESVIICFIGILLGLFISKKWDEKIRIALLSILIIIPSLWSMFNQYYFLQSLSPPLALVKFAIQTGRPLLTLYLIFLFLVGCSIVIPVFFILRSHKVQKIVLEIIDRLSFLMAVYLILDVFALLVIFIRNS